MAKFSFMTLACPNWELEQVAQNAAAYGFSGVELRVAGNRHVDVDMTAQQRQEVVALFKNAGVEICGLASYCRFNGTTTQELQAAQRMLMQCIDLAYDLGAPVVRVFIGDKPQQLTLAQAQRNAAYWLAPCCQYAAMQGVTVALESHDDYCNPDVIKAVFDYMPNTPAKLLWDMQNGWAVGEQDDRMLQVFGVDRIAHVHIRDCRKNAQGQYELCLTGEGEMPLLDMVRRLDAAGYQGYISFEWEKMWQPQLEEPEVALPHFIQYFKAL